MAIISFAPSLFAAGSLVSGAWSIKLWDTPGTLPTIIPATCRASLSSDIECGPRLIPATEIISMKSLNESLLTEYCDSTCTSSIKVSQLQLRECVLAQSITAAEAHAEGVTSRLGRTTSTRAAVQQSMTGDTTSRSLETMSRSRSAGHMTSLA